MTTIVIVTKAGSGHDCVYNVGSTGACRDSATPVLTEPNIAVSDLSSQEAQNFIIHKQSLLPGWTITITTY